MKNLIKMYVETFDSLIEYESKAGRIKVPEESEKIRLKKEFEQKLNNSDRLWGVHPNSDAAYSICNGIFTDVIANIKVKKSDYEGTSIMMDYILGRVCTYKVDYERMDNRTIIVIGSPIGLSIVREAHDGWVEVDGKLMKYEEFDNWLCSISSKRQNNN